MVADASSSAVEPAAVTAMWRAIDVLRPITLAYAAYSTSNRIEDVYRPWVAWAILAVLAAWTVAMFAYRARTIRVVGAELGLACAAILATRLADTAAEIVGGAKTVPGVWPAAAVVSWAVLKGWKGGMFAAACVGLADLVEVLQPNENTVNNIVLLLLLGGCVGYCADLARGGHTALTEALRVQAEIRERDRLARTVHDGVLQTLAYIHRRGQDLGGESRALGAMAGDQERLLRALVSGVSAPDLHQAVGGEVDVRTVLSRYAVGRVHVVPPAHPVLADRRVADELSAAVHAALDNVRRHAGEEASAWLLIEDDGSDVVVTIRDDGAGFAEERLAEAVTSGRMGVSTSIKGRLADLGGSATYDSRPGTGTSVRLRAPKKGQRR
ncbi:MAG TPA: DUF5931 domain-containing protein [Dermatophilaceae bacterium]|nr:DUF5931 domain-containing protein [Dermatophilaceae bacterium]